MPIAQGSQPLSQTGLAFLGCSVFVQCNCDPNLVVSKNSNTLVNTSSENVHLCRVPDFMRKTLNLSLLNKKLAFS